MVPLLIVGVLIVGLVVGPSIWVRRVLARHGHDRPDFPGTGAELARHLLDGLNLHHVTVEPTDRGDHYDPKAKAVRLTPRHHDGRSLAAVVVAAHEVGHAMQDRDGYGPLRVRTEWAGSMILVQRIASAIIFVGPLLSVAGGAPGLALVPIVAGVACMGIPVIMHVFTLPVEIDASYRRALPMLRYGGYLPYRDIPAARQILGAAALTYVAASLMSLVNIGRWLAILLRR